MPRDFFDPTPEQQNIALINAATLREAERLIESCEHYNLEGTEIPFDVILDRITGSDPKRITFWSSRPSAPTAGARFWRRLSLNHSERSMVSHGRFTPRFH